MRSEDTFDRVYKESRRYFTSPWFFAGMALVMGLFAVHLTLSVILQPMAATTRAIGIIIAIGLWLIAGYFFNFWRKWKLVFAWSQDREVLARKAERVDAYLAKVEAGELPVESIPPEILQDWRELIAAWRKELLRQEWRD